MRGSWFYPPPRQQALVGTLSRAFAAPSTASVLPGPHAHSVRVEATEFIVHLPDGRELRAAEAIGTLHRLPGQPALRIGAVKRDVRVPNLFLYELQREDAATRSWLPACTPDANGEHWGFAVEGRIDALGAFVTDPGGLRLTCLAGASSKCVHFGRQSWRGSAADSGSVPSNQAYVRMTRAVCGTSQPDTKAGMLISFWDDKRIVGRRAGAAAFKATWAPHGAMHHAGVPAVERLTSLLDF